MSDGRADAAASAPAQKRRGLRAALIALLSVVAVALVGLPFYVFPAQGDASGAELIYVIGPPNPPRIAEAERLQDELGSKIPVLVSVPPRDSSDWNSTLTAMCHRTGFTCLTPEPFTTKGEALMLDRFRAEHGLEGATVVLTVAPHTLRTRYVFGRCAAAPVSVVHVDEGMTPLGWVYSYLYQTTAWVKAVLTPCSAEGE